MSAEHRLLALALRFARWTAEQACFYVPAITEGDQKTSHRNHGVSPVSIKVFRQICGGMAAGRTGARKGRRQASRGIPKKRLGLVDAEVVDRLEELCGELGLSRDAFTTLVLKEGLRVMTAQGDTEESLMAS